MQSHELAACTPLFCVGAGAALVLLLSVAGDWRAPKSPAFAHLALVTFACLAIALWAQLDQEATTTAFFGALQADGLARAFAALVLFSGCLTVPLAAAYLHEHRLDHGDFFALLLLATVGMLVLCMAGDLLALFIGLEIMSLAVYILAGYRRLDKRGQEAALKYFLYGAFASGFVIYGSALLYGEVGARGGHPSLSFVALHQCFAAGAPSMLGWVGVAFVLGGFAFKVAAVPFHMWAPDVYEGAPTPAAGFMAVGVKVAAFAGLCRFLAATLVAREPANESLLQLFEVLAVLSMWGGNLLAIRQTQIKRMLAYSSIAHAGYLLVGVVAFLAQPDGQALSAIFFYLLAYAAMTLGAFGVVAALERGDDPRLELATSRLAGVARHSPGLGLAMAVFMFGLAGIPPAAGFFGKVSLFSAALAAQRQGVVVAAALASVVGASYYLRVLVTLFMEPGELAERRVVSGWLDAGLLAAAACALGFGLFPAPYVDFAQRALQGWWS